MNHGGTSTVHDRKPPRLATADGIRDLALIGDRRTAAVLDRSGAVLWYCPGRFDQPSLFGALLDAEAGAWWLEVPDGASSRRRYLDDSAALETTLQVHDHARTLTDFMPMGADAPAGLLCRRLSAGRFEVRLRLQARPDYARAPTQLTGQAHCVVIQQRWHLYASHPLQVADDTVSVTLPAGAEGWAVLADAALPDGDVAALDAARIDAWLATTQAQWSRLSEGHAPHGPYHREVRDSLRALRLLTHEASGGLVAAATTSLPEVPGGEKNWDYRYVWLRDAGMIVSALVRADGDLAEGERYLGFICASRGSSGHYPVPIFATLDQIRAPGETVLPWTGYAGSRPVRIGNDAHDQLQLDGFANVLLAAKLIYQRTDRRPHWETVEAIADLLAAHWHEPDHGVWEEAVPRQYTAGKVIAACGLDSIANFASSPPQARRWRAAVREIRVFVAKHCLTSTGAYAVIAGSEAVDVSAALFPVWGYTDADTPEMRATMAVLERDHSWQGLLYWRHLECADARREGAFLAGTLWVAQYWVMRGELDRVRRILDAALAYANDLGLFAEEADSRTGTMLGNFPQAFVHASLIGVVTDLAAAEARSKPSATNPQENTS